MPELPEVEAVKRVLEPQIKGLSILQVTVKRPGVIAHPDQDEFCRRLAGQSISSMGRRGKYLLILLEGGDRIIIHLRMTGCLLLTPADWPEEKHTHLIFRLSSGEELRFVDTRRFGRFWLLGQEEEDRYSGIGKLGKEPFDPEFSALYLRIRFGKRKKAVKECLLDQSVVAGIGNIYSDEILFSSGIYPARPANSLTEEEWERVVEAILRQLSYFIENNQMTPEEYLETKGQDYRNTPFLQVYGKKGEPCPKCGQLFCRMVIGGRSSVFCPHCQKEIVPESCTGRYL